MSISAFMNKLKKYQKLRFAAGLILAGLLFTVIGAVLLSKPQKELLPVEAEVISVRSEQAAGEEQRQYFAAVRYTVDGKSYESEIGCGSTVNKGDQLSLFYDPDQPEDLSTTDSNVILYVITALGAAALAYGIYQLVKTLKTKSDELDQLDRVREENVTEEQRASVLQNTQPEREYYFHFCGKLNQSYVMETPEREEICRADCEKITLVKPTLFTFRDLRTGEVRPVEVSHTVTSRYGSGSFSLPVKSDFSMDGVNVWDVLAEQGYSLEMGLKGIKMNFQLKRYGIPVGRLEAAGANILRDDKQYALGDALPGNGLYKVWCKDDDVAMAFVACFAVSRAEFL